MSYMLTRMCVYFTVFCYLVLGTVVVRFALPEVQTIHFSTSYLNAFSDAPISRTVTTSIVSEPDVTFANIQIPVESKIVKLVKIAKDVETVKISKIIEVPFEKLEILQKNELPFHEPIKLSKVIIKNDQPVNLVANYKEFSFQETIVAKAEEVTDEIKTTQAVTEEVEPEFFEYKQTQKISEKEMNPKFEKENNKKENFEVVLNNEVENQNVADLIEEKSESSPIPEKTDIEPEYFDYPAKLTTQGLASSPRPEILNKEPLKNQASAIIAFDYAKANADMKSESIKTLKKVTSHNSNFAKSLSYKLSDNQKMVSSEAVVPQELLNTASVDTNYSMELLVAAVGSDLSSNEKLQGFEIRFQDDLSEAQEDYGSGEISIESLLSQPKMTRSVTMLKRGFAPTSTEIIMEEGQSAVTIPMIQEDTFNKFQAVYERRGSVGALLVELDDETEVAKIDIPFGDVIKLDGDLRRTDNEDFRYQLFVGVKAGNALLSYHHSNGEIIKKIVHVHENEITYDANFYEDVVNEKVKIYEEDLLAKESSPLIISEDQVRIFASDSYAKKINNHTYKLNFGSSHLAGRRYLELNHQSEPLFVGIRDNNNVTVPSENLMRFILSNVEGAKLGNRCLVQVNLNKKAENVEVAAESVASSLMTYTQMLDSDGKFYDSISSKTQKVIIVGESQSSSDLSADAKINVKIRYQDGSIQFLNSYCSPNTYLVEQL